MKSVTSPGYFLSFSTRFRIWSTAARVLVRVSGPPVCAPGGRRFCSVSAGTKTCQITGDRNETCTGLSQKRPGTFYDSRFRFGFGFWIELDSGAPGECLAQPRESGGNDPGNLPEFCQQLLAKFVENFPEFSPESVGVFRANKDLEAGSFDPAGSPASAKNRRQADKPTGGVGLADPLGSRRSSVAGRRSPWLWSACARCGGSPWPRSRKFFRKIHCRPARSQQF